MPRRRAILTTGAVVAAGALGGLAGAGAVVAYDTPEAAAVSESPAGQQRPASDTEDASVSSVYRKVNKGVVEVTVTTSASAPFGAPSSEQGQAQGSGFVLDAKGHVVTNQHVVDGATDVSVRFWDGSTYSAEIVGTDASTDLAVLVVDAPTAKLHPLSLGSSSSLAVGDGVIAVGSPFGLEGTVTSGIVSALHRQIEAPNNFSIDDAIQTDAAINHGNSGGPLLDSLGRVVGVTSQIESESGGNDGVGFAVPSDTIQPIVTQLIADGSVSHAYLGVAVATITQSAAEQLDLTPGVALTSVTQGTSADEAGLRAATDATVSDGEEVPTGGDVITALDGDPVNTAEELRARIDAKQPGDELKITYVRDGTTRTVTVTLGDRPGAS
jgi:S1-C subfamily serine protease